MTILSDGRIRQLCVPPTHKLDEDRYYRRLSEPHSETLEFVQDQRAHLQKIRERNERIMRECLVETTEEERAAFKPMIEPYVEAQVRAVTRNVFPGREGLGNVLTQPMTREEKKIISYGTSSYGYDVRCAREFKIFTNINSSIVDPKAFDPKSFVDVEADVCIIPPNSFALARTVEYFRIPRNVLTICLGKSTYARCGIIVNVTPLEPEWEGHVTLEFSNTTPLPAKIYANEGVAQMLFFEADDVCETSYADRAGKYMGQTGVVIPRV